jgi:hypothetical protein
MSYNSMLVLQKKGNLVGVDLAHARMDLCCNTDIAQLRQRLKD